MKITDSLISNMLISGRSAKSINKEYGVSMRRIKRVMEHGESYVNLATGEVAVIGKENNVSEDIFVILYDYCFGKENGVKEVSDMTGDIPPLVYQKSLIKRLSSYCGISYDKALRLKRKDPVVLSSTNDIRLQIIIKYEEEFEVKFRESFYQEDEYGYFRGFKLYYLKYTTMQDFAYYINLKVFKGISRAERFSEKEFVIKTKGEGYIEYLSSKVAFYLYEWAINKIVLGYTESEIRCCLKSHERYSVENYYGELVVPFAIYYDTRGLSELSDIAKSKMIEQLNRGEILGVKFLGGICDEERVAQ
ncbi:MAG: hypothetical protein ACRCZ1_01015 [Cetobacterium sp.]